MAKMLVEIEIEHELPSEDVEALRELGAEGISSMISAKEPEIKRYIASYLDVLPEEITHLAMTFDGLEVG